MNHKKELEKQSSSYSNARHKQGFSIQLKISASTIEETESVLTNLGQDFKVLASSRFLKNRDISGYHMYASIFRRYSE